MKPLELKKCESKLNALIKHLKSRESDKMAIEREIVKKKLEIKGLSSQIRMSGANRQKIGEELKNLRAQRDILHADMNRIKAGLLYKTKGEYEDMIKRFENEMRNNSRSFSRLEESRLLNDIKQHKHGISQLELYEDRKKSYDKLNDSFKNKKLEQDETWNLDNLNKHKLNILNEECKQLNKNIAEITLEIEELNKNKLELKKMLEDLIRENVLRQQKARKNSLEKSTKKNKEDDIVQSMESTVRDYNKLINYYHKLSNQEDSDYTNTPSSSNALKLSLSASNSPMTDSSLYSSLPVYFTTQTSIQNNKATTKSEDETEFQNENIQAVKFARELEPPKSLNLFESTTKFNANRSSPNFLTVSAQTLVQSPSYDSFKLSQLSVTTPTPTTDEPTGSFIMKKKLDDEGAGNSNRWTSGHHRKRLNTKKPKTNKVSHCVEIINLLSKLNIPIELSSQVDQCIKILTNNRDQIMDELNLYKSTQLSIRAACKSLSSPRDLGPHSQKKSVDEDDIFLKKSDSNSFQQPQPRQIDNRSDISSCLDSNYESDNNSINYNSFNSVSFSSDNSTAAAAAAATENQFSIFDKDDEFTELSMNKTKPHKAQNSSDDSDATLNDCKLGLIDFQLKKSNINSGTNKSSASSSNSDNTIAPGSPKTPTPLSVSACSDLLSSGGDSSCLSLKNENSNENNVRLKISRQLSDGYSSSGTPLSASSINNEHPAQNPFFQRENSNN